MFSYGYVLAILVAAVCPGKFVESTSLPKITLKLKEYVSVFEAPREPGERGSRSIHVSEYYGKVAVGSPAQYFDVVFDTGSGNIVLPTVKCSEEACQKHRRYLAKSSSSAIQIAFEDGTPLRADDEYDRDTTTITYGTGKLTGEYIRDKLCMDGEQDGQACTDVDFLGVTQESRFPFIELPFDGIFGLGLAGLSAGVNFNFVGRLCGGNSTIKEPIFAFFLRKLDVDEESEITFGGFQPERLQGGLTWLPVPKDEADDKGYWLVTMRDIYVGGKPLGLCNDVDQHQRCQVAMDTGTSLMMAPSYQVNPVLEAIGLADDCSNAEGLPTLRFVLDTAAGGTFELELGPQEYMERSPGGCATAFQAIELPPTLGAMWVVGQTALRKYYTVYDAKNWQVGVGLARHSSTLLQASEPSTTQAAVEVSEKESCQDDNMHMSFSHLPGCKTFRDMGYCTRFKPLAHHYCRLSCELCHLPGGSPTLTDEAEQPMTAGDGDQALVRGRGMKIIRQRRQTINEEEKPTSGWRLS
mmetsp:Transcript_39188/g.92249  ORF Transcript_39188/g.92249 Transcript_39188/m.92249 type:complete len:524 (+) Transcript_39188:84-1655(+)